MPPRPLRRLFKKEKSMILYKSKSAVVINKPAGMPSERDNSGDLDALSATKNLLTEMGECSDLWLVHRLDRVVGGVMIFARTKSSAAELSAMIGEHQFVKEYLAVVDGQVEDGRMQDLIYRDAIRSRAVVTNMQQKGAKPAVLYARTVETKETPKGMRTLVGVTLQTGRFHQIRAQLASRGAAITCDAKYGSKDRGARMPALFAKHLQIDLCGEKIDCSAIPDTSAYPWCLFDLSKL